MTGPAMLKPKAAVRRFDVFAEYNRQTALDQGSSPSQAKGYGLWVAKVVAARRYGKPPQPSGEKHASGEKPKARATKWHALGGKPQTDKLFDKEIVQRMGSDFYARVFVPAIHKAIEKGEKYPEIRDAIRREWNP
jgi:hypothetical protein